jgi:CopA family copper-resistance protein
MKKDNCLNKIWVAFLFVIISTASLFAQQVVRYDLYVKDTIVNFTGKEKRAISVNGQIPMPTLVFTEGDTAEIHVHNQLNEGTSLHWHGIHLPNKEDGVPYLTQMPIAPNTTHVYRFAIIQNGTHWYHSHSGLQEQIGMYGSLILKKRSDDPTFRKGIDDLAAVPVLLSEWTDYNPKNVNRLLHSGTDWFAIKKGATQSYSEAIQAGHFMTKLTNEWKRLLAMDVSDIYYNKFLINGQSESQLSNFKAGDKVRLQISNGGGSSYFWLNYAGGKMTVVANDGNDVEPVEVDRLIIGTSETYDVIVTIPMDNMAYQFRATAEDRTGAASIFLGSGTEKRMNPLPPLKYFEGMKMMNKMMHMDGTMDDMGMNMSLQKMDMNRVMYPEVSAQKGAMQMDDKMGKQGKDKDMHEKHMEGMDKEEHDMEGMEKHGMEWTWRIKIRKWYGMDHSKHQSAQTGMVTLNYAMLKSPTKTILPADAPVREFRFELTGNMNRYVWSLDNRVLSESDKIMIKKGEIIRITLTQQFNDASPHAFARP